MGCVCVGVGKVVLLYAALEPTWQLGCVVLIHCEVGKHLSYLDLSSEECCRELPAEELSGMIGTGLTVHKPRVCLSHFQQDAFLFASLGKGIFQEILGLEISFYQQLHLA